MSDRVLPHSLDAERSVLGAVLVDPDAVYVVGGVLTAQDFYQDANARIYAAMVALAEAGVPCDHVTLRNELLRRGEMDKVGGLAYVTGLDHGVPRSTNVEFYAKIVREKAIKRALIDAAHRVEAAAYEDSDDSQTVLDAAERAMLAVSQDAMSGDLIFADRLVPDAMAMLEQITQTKRPVTGLSTGISMLDSYTRGLHPGNLVVVGGRPGDGKSALALQIALHVAKEQPVAFFCMEMSKEELMFRAFAQQARVDHHLMMAGQLSAADQRKVAGARDVVEHLPIAFDDTSALTPFQIRSKVKKMQARRGIGLVVVDYLQLLQRPRHAHSREEAVGDNTWALKVLAGEMKVPVMALSQLNRSSAKDNTRPTLTDLRESGAIEQHANVVMLIFQPITDEDGTGPDSRPAEVILAKQRNGPRGVHVDLHFRGPWMRFEEPEWRQR